MAAMKAIHPLIDSQELEKQRASLDMVSILVPPSSKTSCETIDIGVSCAWLRRKKRRRLGRAVLYLHGGAYITGSLKYARVIASRLAGYTGYDTLALEYRLAPEHPYPAAPDDALMAWEHMLSVGYRADKISVCGDSAGGNLALVLALKLRELGRELPASLVLMSPWGDLSCSGASYTFLKDVDPTTSLEGVKLAAAMYAAGHPFDHPMLSPLKADFAGFPKTLIQVGTRDLPMSDSLDIAAKMMNAGVPCDLQIWEGMCHVFQLYPFKESKAAWKKIAAFLLG